MNSVFFHNISGKQKKQTLNKSKHVKKLSPKISPQLLLRLAPPTAPQGHACCDNLIGWQNLTITNPYLQPNTAQCHGPPAGPLNPYPADRDRGAICKQLASG